MAVVFKNASNYNVPSDVIDYYNNNKEYFSKQSNASLLYHENKLYFIHKHCIVSEDECIRFDDYSVCVDTDGLYIGDTESILYMSDWYEQYFLIGLQKQRNNKC